MVGSIYFYNQYKMPEEGIFIVEKYNGVILRGNTFFVDVNGHWEAKPDVSVSQEIQTDDNWDYAKLAGQFYVSSQTKKGFRVKLDKEKKFIIQAEQ